MKGLSGLFKAWATFPVQSQISGKPFLFWSWIFVAAFLSLRSLHLCCSQTPSPLQNSLLKNTSVECRFVFLNAVDNCFPEDQVASGPSHAMVFTLPPPNGTAFVRMKRGEPTQCTARAQGQVLTFLIF